MNFSKHLSLLFALVFFSLNQAFSQVNACNYASLTNPVDGLIIDKHNYSSYIQNGDEIIVDGSSTTGITSNLIISINGYTPSPVSGNVPNPSTGTWYKTISLSPGINAIALTAKCGISGCLQVGNPCATHTVTFVKPLDSGNFSTSVVNGTDIKISWTPHYGSTTFYYRVRKNTVNDAATSWPISSFTSTQTEYVDQNVTVGTTYYYFMDVALQSNGTYSAPLLGGNSGVVNGSISLSDYSETFSELGATETISVTSNMNFTSVASASWISVSPSTGNAGNTSVNITAGPNTTGSQRSGTVTFTTADGNSTQTYYITQPTQILPPGGVNVANITTNSADLSWSSVPSANSYNLFDCNGNLIANVNGTSYTMTGLNDNTNYDFKVQTVASGGNSVFTSCINFTTLTSGVTTTIQSMNVCELDTFEVAVIADGATNVGAISLKMPFDNVLLKYLDVIKIHSNLAGSTFLYFETGGVVSVAWTADIIGGNLSATIPSNDTLFKIKFVALSDGTASVDFDLNTQGACSYADASLATINGTFNNGLTTIFDLPIALLSSSDVDNVICYNDLVVLSTTLPTNHEAIFYINNLAVTTQSSNASYTTTTLNDGDEVTVEVINTLTGCSEFSQPQIFVVDCGNVSGHLKYDNTVQTPIDSAMVYLFKVDGTFVDSAMADINGFYEFTDLSNNSYYVTISTGKPNQGVNATDALAILHHVVQTPGFVLQNIALKSSDVNLSTTTTSLDALEVMQKFVNILPAFAAGNYVFEDIIFSVTSGNTVNDIYGLCVGDVTKSNIPSVGRTESPSITLVENGIIASNVGEIIRIPVLATDRITPAALTLEFDYPSQILEIQNIEVKGQGTINNTVFSNGSIKIAGVNIQGISLEANDTLLVIEAKVLSSYTSTNPILSVSARSELADVMAVKMDNITLSIPELSITTWVEAQLKEAGFDWKVFPNPFNVQANIHYTLPENGEVTIVLFDGIGRIVRVMTEQEHQAGEHQFVLKKSELPASGIYNLTILFNGQTYKNVQITTSVQHQK